MTYWSLLFSDQSLRLARMDHRNKRLKNFFEFPLPPGLIHDGEVENPKELGKFLSQIKSKIKLNETFVVVGIPEIKASLHTLTLPFLAEKEIDQAVRRQADTFLPFAYQNEYLDWMIIDTPSDSQIKVLVSAVPRSVIDGFITALQQASLAPISFETTSLSLFRLLPPEGKKSSFAAQVENTSTVLILGSEGNVEACSVVRQPEQILETVQKMNQFYQHKTARETPRQIYLCGLALSVELAQKIKDQLHLQPILLKTSLTNIPAGKQSDWAIVASLAQKKVTPPSDSRTINLLPAHLVDQYQKTIESRCLTHRLSWLLLFLLLLNGLTFFAYGKHQQQAASDRSRQPISRPLSEKLQDKAKLITRLGQANSRLEILALFQLSNQKLQVNNLSYDSPTAEIILTGYTQNRNDLLELKKKLESDYHFSQVSLPLSSLEKADQSEFKIKISL
ncbi:MAG: pilus assembly protein PilM [Candidatus Shapirobacteria bacterium]